MTRPEKPLLLLVATGFQRYREYLLRSIATRYRVHLISPGEPGWERPYLEGSTTVPDMATDRVLAAARSVARARPVAGAMSWHEEHIVQAALVAEELGLPTSPVVAVRRCRDKFATRTALAERNLPQPAFLLAGDADEAAAAADKLSYPVVLKPRSAGGSQGVVLARDADEIADLFTFPSGVEIPHVPAYDQAVLVEEYLDAPEISVDSVVHRGRVTPVFVGRKQLGFPPYFEETGHLVGNTDPLLSDNGFLRTLSDVHAALGYTDGWTHSEFKLTPDGPKLIEVNGRLGGDLIPYVGMLASGIDPGLAAAAVACGEEPDVEATSTSVAGVRFFYPERDETVVESVEFDREALPAEVAVTTRLVEPGAVVSPPPKGLIFGRIALAIAVAPTPAACHVALDGAQAALRVRIAGR
jgi:biotin carboxylase